MIEKDTVRLLRECDAGIKMGVDSIEDVLPDIESDELEEKLTNSKNEHIELQKDLQELLDNYHDDGKDPNPIAKTMSWMKTSFKMATDKSDKTAADLMTDGCNMGIKSLAKYLNEYKAADEKSKDIAKKVINLEEKLVRDLREYL